MKKGFIGAALLSVALLVTGCSTEADRASQNVSYAADSFQVNRRIVFYNGITGEYILVIEGYCSLGNFDSAGQLSVTCKVNDGDTENAYKKHFLGLSDNVTFFAEQIDPIAVKADAYKVQFKPSAILPSIEVK